MDSTVLAYLTNMLIALFYPGETLYDSIRAPAKLVQNLWKMCVNPWKEMFDIKKAPVE